MSVRKENLHFCQTKIHTTDKIDIKLRGKSILSYNDRKCNTFLLKQKVRRIEADAPKNAAPFAATQIFRQLYIEHEKES